MNVAQLIVFSSTCTQSPPHAVNVQFVGPNITNIYFENSKYENYAKKELAVTKYSTETLILVKMHEKYIYRSNLHGRSRMINDLSFDLLLFKTRSLWYFIFVIVSPYIIYQIYIIFQELEEWRNGLSLYASNYFYSLLFLPQYLNNRSQMFPPINMSRQSMHIIQHF